MRLGHWRHDLAPSVCQPAAACSEPVPRGDFSISKPLQLFSSISPHLRERSGSCKVQPASSSWAKSGERTLPSARGRTAHEPKSERWFMRLSRRQKKPALPFVLLLLRFNLAVSSSPSDNSIARGKADRARFDQALNCKSGDCIATRTPDDVRFGDPLANGVEYMSLRAFLLSVALGVTIVPTHAAAASSPCPDPGAVCNVQCCDCSIWRACWITETGIGVCSPVRYGHAPRSRQANERRR
jgi:hypothetical protein